MYLMIREGSAARNLEELLPVVTPATDSRCMFVSDDRHPRDILSEGHMDHILRKGVRLGMNPIIALRMATINPARAFMRRHIGATAPGYRADIVLVNDLEGFVVRTVIKDGEIVVRDGEMVIDLPHGIDDRARKTMRVKDLSLDRLKIRISGNRVRVIELIAGQICTRQVIEDVPVRENGEVMADPARDLLKIAVIERHRATGNIGLGFVRGFGLKNGALGSSVAHDSHNIIVIGTNDRDMHLAARKIIEIGGGHVVVSGGKILGSLPLPIAGLLSDRSLEELVSEEERLLSAARGLGARPASPFIKLSFLALPVIPELKITDKGLIDVSRFEVVDIEP
jgi:adenine deaminase